ncbi:hypothetical protein ACUNWD_03815 [Sunxiuqinia sp. A32]|uniref:hypothetical protein n=1 Tax=Sunxiuqinia sp. A32 TaxID=3461496 RepID=UPI004045B7E4
MKKLFITTLLFITIISYSNAQEYNTGIGIRGGFAQGLTVKHFIGESTALEGILSTRWGGFNITGLYEIHNPAFNVAGMYWYYGFGGHIGFWDGHQVHDWFDDDNTYTVIGIDGVLGLEYNIPGAPINLSLDWKPAMNIIGHTGFWGDGGALSIRYIF